MALHWMLMYLAGVELTILISCSQAVDGQDADNCSAVCPTVCLDCSDRPTWVILGLCAGGALVVGGFLTGSTVYCCCARTARKKLARMYLERGGTSQFYSNPAAMTQLDERPRAAARRSADGDTFPSSPTRPMALPRGGGEIRSSHPRLSVTSEESSDAGGGGTPRQFSKAMVVERRERRSTDFGFAGLANSNKFQDTV